MSPLVITLGIVLAIAFIGLILWTQSKRKKIDPKHKARFQAHWKTIQQLSISHPEKAILEADKLLDQALKLKGYEGHLGEKLKQAGSIFSNLDATWKAHKLRNQIAHELDFKLSPSQIKEALNAFKKALQDLGAY